MGQATHVTNWTTKSASALSRRGLKYVIEPATIYPGDPVTISLYDFSEYGLESPYLGLSGKTIGLTNDAKTETVSLSGSQDVHSEFPIHAVENILCQFEVVDEASRALIYPRGADLSGSVGVVAGDLKLNFGASIKPHGTIKLLYDTVKAQIWHHEAFSDAGTAVLFALKNGAIDYELIPITISERSSNASGAAFEIVTAQLPRSYFGLSSQVAGNPYAAFVILGAVNPRVITSLGTVAAKGKIEHFLYAQKIELDGSGIVPIKHKVINLFWNCEFCRDKSGTEISANLRASGGKIITNPGVFGTITVNYSVEGLLYNYFSEVTTLPGGAANEEIGDVMATENGVTVSYQIPAHVAGDSAESTVLEVSYQVVNSDRGVHEYPPNYTNNPVDVTYPGYSFTESQLLTRYSKHPVNSVVVAYLKVVGSSVVPYREANRSQLPFLLTQDAIWIDRKYSIKKTIPADASPEMTSEINAWEVQLKTEFNIA